MIDVAIFWIWHDYGNYEHIEAVDTSMRPIMPTPQRDMKLGEEKENVLYLGREAEQYVKKLK